MNEWWNQMEFFEQILWLIAAPVSVVFIIQMFMTFFGLSSDGMMADFSGDINSDVDLGGPGDVSDHFHVGPFQIFTVRNFINFFLAFSWTGIAFYPHVENKFTLVIISTFSGLVLVGIVILIFYFLSKTIETGNTDIQKALYKEAQVYLPIPQGKTGTGKVQITLQGSVRELDAMTEGERLATGQMVRVKAISSNHILIVEKL